MKDGQPEPRNDRPARPAGFVSPKTVAIYGVLIALTAAVTYSSAAPFSPTKGYFNLGDSMVFFSALAFGWRAGAICGGVGSALADILLGFGIFAPVTLTAKGVEGLVAGGIGARKYGKVFPIVLAAVAGTFVLVVTSILLYDGGLADADQPLSLTVVLVPLLAIVVAAAVYLIFSRGSERVRTWTPVALGVALGGTCMIVIYFLGEWLLLDVGLGKAILEIPINIAQAVIGGTIGSFLSHRVKKYYPSLRRGM
jgi:uncharacterized membrane protein